MELPAEPPPAPWHCRCDGIAWLVRAAGARGPAGRTLLGGGALLRYAETPVGPYQEVQALLGQFTRHGVMVTVPFIAVDSPASVVGGRRNWNLPKQQARFTGGRAAMIAHGDGWMVSARARPIAPAVPVRLAGRLAQPGPDGTLTLASGSGTARMRPALVEVRVEIRVGRGGGAEADPPPWLRSGRHLGAVINSAEFTLGPSDQRSR